MNDTATNAAELAAFLEALGHTVLRDDDGETIGVELGGGRVAALRWSARSRSVLLSIPTGLRVPAAYFGAALLELARIDDRLEAPGFVLDLDDGSIEYRARLVTRRDRRLDLEVFDDTLAAAIAIVAEALPDLRRALGRTRHSALRSAAAALAGYVE